MNRPNRASPRALCLAVVLATASAASRAAAPPAAPTQEQAKARYDRIVESYLESKWGDLAEALKAPSKELALLTPQQRADIAYVRTAWAQCRPDWWQAARGSRKANLRVELWGRRFPVTFEPNEKGGVNVQTLGGRTTVTVSWSPSQLDSTEPAAGSMAGHGCTAGDMADLNVWGTLANAYLMAGMPHNTLADLYNRDKDGFLRYQLFRSNVACLYHGSPHSRHAMLVICLAAFMPKYGSGSQAGASRAVGAMLVAEVLADPAKWPSLPLPRSVAQDDAEAKVAVHYKFRVGKAWTLAEDKALREATLAFAKANDREVLKSGKVVLPNQLVFMLDAAKDEPLKAKRDEWVAGRLDKALAAGTHAGGGE